MAENQHRRIEGYRDFKEEIICRINQIKGVGNTQVMPLIQEIKQFHEDELKQLMRDSNERGSMFTEEENRLIREGARCREQAEEHFRLAFMMLIRSVARPTTEY
jgi:DNA-binding transcriptional MerR regulator